jgi:hypothetical protein
MEASKARHLKGGLRTRLIDGALRPIVANVRSAQLHDELRRPIDCWSRKWS